jgi:hypothetical protein
MKLGKPMGSPIWNNCTDNLLNGISIDPSKSIGFKVKTKYIWKIRIYNRINISILKCF